jgi:hypothetical protein
MFVLACFSGLCLAAPSGSISLDVKAREGVTMQKLRANKSGELEAATFEHEGKSMTLVQTGWGSSGPTFVAKMPNGNTLPTKVTMGPEKQGVVIIVIVIIIKKKKKSLTVDLEVQA